MQQEECKVKNQAYEYMNWPRIEGILYGEEVTGTKKVLKAAALTYVAAAAGSILQLLRLLILFGGRNRRD